MSTPPESDPRLDGIYVTMEDIARKAGVSLSTVSRALRDHHRISQRTRDRIKGLVDRMGYRTNPLVSALMVQLRTSRPSDAVCNLAWLDFYDGPEDWKKFTVQRAFYEGALARAKLKGYAIERVQAKSPGMTPARLTQILVTRGSRGVLLPDFRDSHGLSGSIPLSLEKFALVSVGSRFQQPALPFVSNDQYASCRTAVLELWARGYRRIGYIGEPGIERIVNNRFAAGYLTTLQVEIGTKSLPPLFTFDDREALPWIAAHRPDAVITTNRTVYSVLKAARLKIPAELGFAHLNVRDCEGNTENQVTGIRQHNDAAGAAAVDLLVELLASNEIGPPAHPKGVLLPGTWINGTTVLDHVLAPVPTPRSRRRTQG